MCRHQERAHNEAARRTLQSRCEHCVQILVFSKESPEKHGLRSARAKRRHQPRRIRLPEIGDVYEITDRQVAKYLAVVRGYGAWNQASAVVNEVADCTALGLGPLQKAIELLYPGMLKARAILCTSRPLRKGIEEDGLTFYFLPASLIKSLMGNPDFAVSRVRSDWQAIDLVQVEDLLSSNDLVFAEVHHSFCETPTCEGQREERAIVDHLPHPCRLGHTTGECHSDHAAEIGPACDGRHCEKKRTIKRGIRGNGKRYPLVNDRVGIDPLQ